MYCNQAIQHFFFLKVQSSIVGVLVVIEGSYYFKFFRYFTVWPAVICRSVTIITQSHNRNYYFLCNRDYFVVIALVDSMLKRVNILKKNKLVEIAYFQYQCSFKSIKLTNMSCHFFVYLGYVSYLPCATSNPAGQTET